MRPVVLLALLASGVTQAQDPGTRGYARPFALTNARIETVSRGVIERGTVVLRDGRIAAVGADVAVPSDAEVVDCAGLTLYPGMIDAGTKLGLQEIGAVDVTIDLDEVGDLTPQMEALTAVNPNSVLIPVTRVAGVTTALAVPTGGLLPGTAALVNLHGYTPEQMFAEFRGVVLEWPSGVARGPGDERTDEKRKEELDEAMERMDTMWEEAETYARIDSALAAHEGRSPELRGSRREAAPRPFQPEAAALAPVTRGETALLVEVNAAADILKALEWLDKKPRVWAVLMGVAEGWRVADRIAAAGLPALVGPVTALPTRASDRYSRAYENAALLHRAGVRVALRTTEAENVRNLPFQAGFAVAYGAEHGFDREAALRAVTLGPAEVFGVADRLGSIEVGKDATLFAADGDPFEPRTQVRHLFIGGYRLPLVSRQTVLYDEFLRRDPGVGPESVSGE